MVSPDVDIWSLDCVTSAFAVWLYFGQTGLNNYNKARRQELKGVPGFQSDDCFHGKKMLSAVGQWYSKVRNRLSESDTITRLVLQLVEDNML